MTTSDPAAPQARILVAADVFKGKVGRRSVHHESAQGRRIFATWIGKAFDGEVAVEQALDEATQIVSWKSKPTFPE